MYTHEIIATLPERLKPFKEFDKFIKWAKIDKNYYLF